MKKYKWQTTYTIFVTIFLLLVSAALCVVFFREGYDTKILTKLGFKDEIKETNWAVDGWNNTLRKLDYDADIVFFGDSITRGSDFRKTFPNTKIINLGYSGDTLEGMIDRVDGVASVEPEQVFVMGGINDLTDKNIEECILMYEELLDEMIGTLPKTKVFVQSVLPISAEKEKTYCQNSTIVLFNERLKAIANERGMVYVDLYSLYEKGGEMDSKLTRDGIHLYSEAYKCWADAISPFILFK